MPLEKSPRKLYARKLLLVVAIAIDFLISSFVVERREIVFGGRWRRQSRMAEINSFELSSQPSVSRISIVCG
jgi:hypothetical protein